MFGRHVPLPFHHCKRDEVYFTLRDKPLDGKNGLISRTMLVSELYKIMVNKVTFVGFRGGDRPPPPGSAPAYAGYSNLNKSLKSGRPLERFILKRIVTTQS